MHEHPGSARLCPPGHPLDGSPERLPFWPAAWLTSRTAYLPSSAATRGSEAESPLMSSAATTCSITRGCWTGSSRTRERVDCGTIGTEYDRPRASTTTFGRAAQLLRAGSV